MAPKRGAVAGHDAGDAAHRRGRGCDVESGLEVDGVCESAEHDGRDSAEAHREAHGEAAGHADMAREVELAQHHRHAERADDAEADEHERDRAWDSPDCDEGDDQKRDRRLRHEERPAEPDAVRNRAEHERADRSRDEHQRQLAPTLALGPATGDDPERDEREEREPRDAPQDDHDRENTHRAHVVLARALAWA